MGMEAWIRHFTDLELYGVIDTSDDLHMECIRYCYMNILQLELDNVTIEWNTHHIITNSVTWSPSGKPDVMYHFPQLYGAESYLQHYDAESYNEISAIAAEDLPGCLPMYKDIFESVVRERSLPEPNNIHEAATLLTTLLDCIEDELRDLR